MSERLDRLEALAETMLLAIKQQKDQQDFDRQEWRSGVNAGVAMIGSLAEHMGEMQVEIKGLQTENHRMLDYLFNQQNHN